MRDSVLAIVKLLSAFLRVEANRDKALAMAKGMQTVAEEFEAEQRKRSERIRDGAK